MIQSVGWAGLLLLTAAAAMGLTVSVVTPQGAPRLMVDGQPVRGRMFWGGPGSRPLALPADGQVVTTEFRALADEPEHATMHLRFGGTPGTIVLDDLQVTDTATGRDVIAANRFEGEADSFRQEWTFWPTGEQNTVADVQVVPGAGRDGSGGLRITLTNPKSGAWPDWHLYHHANLRLEQGHTYRISLWVKAEPARTVKIAFYRPGTSFVFLGGPGDVFGPQVRMAGEAGAPFVSFPMPLPWPKPGEAADFAAVDNAAANVLSANPDALLIPRIGMAAPSWWLDAHPDEIMTWDRGDHRRMETVAGPNYRRDAAARLKALVEHLETTYPDRIAGYHPSGQNTGEWFYMDTWQHVLNGYAPADEEAFRAWLRGKYGRDEALQQAWSDPVVTIAMATVPTAVARYAHPAGILRDPVNEAQILDFNAFQQESMATWVCEMAKAIKDGCQRRKLAVFFYGYVFEFAPVSTGPATSGHYGLRTVLNCPDVDLLCSPISYWDRGAGGTAPTMTAAESVALAGKLWLNEDDTHTYLASEPFPGSREHVTTLAETNHLMVRNTAQAACRNLACWWMDLGSSGWFNDPAIWAEMKRLAPVDQTFLDQPTPYRPEVAAIVDEQAMIAVAEGGYRVTRKTVYEARTAFGRMGAPFGQYLQDDVAANRVAAKLLVFLSPWRMDAPQRRQLLDAGRGRAKVWCYAPGYLEGQQTSLKAMRELTGFELRAVDVPQALASPTPQGLKLGLQPLGVEERITPLFAAADATEAETLARWSDGSAAIALRQTPDGLTAFVGTPGLSPALLRILAERAGVKLFCRSDCNVYANGPIVAVHGAVDGPVQLDLGGTGPVADALTGEQVSDEPTFSLALRKGETRVFRRPLR